MRKLYIILILVIPLSMAFSLFRSPGSLGELNLEKIDTYDQVENLQLSNLEIVGDCSPPTSFDYVSKQNGDWKSNTTWVGNAPPTDAISDISIKITHYVWVTDDKIEMGGEHGSELYVAEGGILEIRKNEFKLLPGNNRAIFHDAELRVSGELINEDNSSFCMINSILWSGEEECGQEFVSGEANTSSNFKNIKGYRYLENVCANVTQDFQNNEGVDHIINSCIDVGDQKWADKSPDDSDSGNFQNNKGTMTIVGSEFYVAQNIDNTGNMDITNSDFRTTNGNFKHDDGSITGGDIVIWIDCNSHEIYSHGSWDGSTVSHWYNKSSNPQPPPNLPPKSSLDEIAVHFNCGCDPDPLASIGDYVWFDNGNIDGVQETGEPGIENVNIQLFKAGSQSGKVLEVVFKETTTDENGYYIFKDLEAGEYYLKFQCPGELHMCPCDAGTNDAKDSDIEHHIDDPEDIGRTPDITLNWNEHNMTIDGGFTQAPLPLEFGSLTAKVQGEDVVLEWSTYTEVNNEGFYIERTNRGVEGFREITFIEGLGNSTEVQNYAYTDQSIMTGTQYEYRIKYIGMDGEIAYSETVSVTIGSVSRMAIYPNPTTGIIQVNLPESMINPVIQVYDPIGRLIYDFRPQESITTHTYDLSSLNNGFYLIVALDANVSFSERIIITH